MKEKKTKIATVRLSTKTYEKLLVVAEKRVSSVSPVIREAILFFLNKKVQ